MNPGVIWTLQFQTGSLGHNGANIVNRFTMFWIMSCGGEDLHLSLTSKRNIQARKTF